jgi:hypothetical protein
LVVSFTSCLMDETRWWSVFLFDVDLKTFKCIIIVLSLYFPVLTKKLVGSVLLILYYYVFIVCLYYVSVRSEFCVVMSVAISA